MHDESFLANNYVTWNMFGNKRIKILLEIQLVSTNTWLTEFVTIAASLTT